MNSDEIIRLIAAEIQTGKLDVVVWTRAFAEADGNHDKAKARYIRDRQAQLQAHAALSTPATAAPGKNPGESRPTAARPRSELEVKREILAKKLGLLGRRSLYDELDLHPANDEATVSHAIASLRAAEAQGRVLSAEERYAIQMLGDTASREQYDRKLLEELSRPEAAGQKNEAPLPRDAFEIRPLNLIGVVGLLAVLAFAALGFYQEQSRKELVRETLRAQQQAEATRLEREKQAAAERSAQQAEAAERAAQLAEQQTLLRQRQIDDQARIRSTQMEIQLEQAEERKRLAALARQQAEARAEQEKIRRTVYETERELCLTARRNNNLGEVTRWCR